MKALADIKLSPRDRAAIEEAARLLRSQFPIEQIILFGSKARGDDDAESDIDLLLLTSRPLTRAETLAVLEALFPVQLSNDVVLSPLILPIQDWTSGRISVLPIRHEIEEHGVTA